jgi:hypothetical protein
MSSSRQEAEEAEEAEESCSRRPELGVRVSERCWWRALLLVLLMVLLMLLLVLLTLLGENTAALNGRTNLSCCDKSLYCPLRSFSSVLLSLCLLSVSFSLSVSLILSHAAPCGI